MHSRLQMDANDCSSTVTVITSAPFPPLVTNFSRSTQECTKCWNRNVLTPRGVPYTPLQGRPHSLGVSEQPKAKRTDIFASKIICDKPDKRRVY